MLDAMFWEIHSNLPREGPGNAESTQRAFHMMRDLPSEPELLDVACGPGMQTMDLLNLSGGAITAVDTHQAFLDDLKRRAEAAGVADRIRIMNASMFSMPFENNSFDIIWCEGAMYIMGVPQALGNWKRFLRSGGYIAFTEPCFLQDDLPQEVREFWAEYPAMTSVEATLKAIGEAGYTAIGNFTIPDSAWWGDYYGPMEERLKMLRQKYAGDKEALQRLEENQSEIDLHRKFSAYYGYVFFVARKD